MDDYIQMTPEMVDAKKQGDVARLLQLVESGEDLRAIDYQEGWTMLHWAAHHGHTGLARALLDRGADIECRDEESETPLMLAAHSGHLDMVRLLLERGANPAAETHAWDASDFARMKNHTSIQLLIGMAIKKVEPTSAAEKRASAKAERLQALDAKAAVELFLARSENLQSSDPLVGVWQTLGSTWVCNADGTLTIVGHGGRTGAGPLTHWSATSDGEFIYDSTPLGLGGKVTRHQWRVSNEGKRLFLTNEFGGVAEFERQEPKREP